MRGWRISRTGFYLRPRRDTVCTIRPRWSCSFGSRGSLRGRRLGIGMYFRLRRRRPTRWTEAAPTPGRRPILPASAGSRLNRRRASLCRRPTPGAGRRAEKPLPGRCPKSRRSRGGAGRRIPGCHRNGASCDASPPFRSHCGGLSCREDPLSARFSGREVYDGCPGDPAEHPAAERGGIF